MTVGVTGGLGMLMPPYIPLGCTRNRFLFETPLLCCLTFLVALTYCTTSTRGQEMKTDRFEINQQLSLIGPPLLYYKVPSESTN